MLSGWRRASAPAQSDLCTRPFASAWCSTGDGFHHSAGARPASASATTRSPPRRTCAFFAQEHSSARVDANERDERNPQAALAVACGFHATDLANLAGYFTTVATVLAALVVGLVFSAILADPSDRFAPSFRWLAVYLAAALIASCAGLVPGRSSTFIRQCFAVSSGGATASVIGLLLLVIRARGNRPTLATWLESLKTAGFDVQGPGERE